MKLSQLLSVLGADCPQDAEITALACDSREVVPGALFAALPGHRADGRAYIADALDRGAAAVVCAPPLPPPGPPRGIAAAPPPGPQASPPGGAPGPPPPPRHGGGGGGPPPPPPGGAF